MRHSPSLLIVLILGLPLFTGCDSVAPAGADLSPLPAAESSARVVKLTFDKTGDWSGVWHGTVEGAFGGDLETVLIDARGTGPILHVEFDWIVTNTAGGAYDFVARLSGILNQNTGGVVMNGRVTSGYLAGARVHEQGQLIDPATARFQGIINIMPATAR